MSVVEYVPDNLETGTVKKVTSDALQLESGQVVVRGEVLKKGTTGLVALAATTDVPYTVSYQNIDATAGAMDITYCSQGSFLNSELTYAVGTIEDYRDKFVASTQIVIEE
jgi:hypothetical protein